ncbi:MAG: hypothetical protein QM478_11515 [Flavobacteriaceae bacterium]
MKNKSDGRINNGGKRVGAGRPVIRNPKRNKTLNLSVETHLNLVTLSSTLNLSQAIIIERLVALNVKNINLID